MQALQKKLWVHFSNFWSKNEAVCREVQTHFGSSLPARFTEKSSGRSFTIYLSKNEAVCCEVQMHFGSFRLTRFTEKVLAAFSRFVRPKPKLFAVKFRRILTFSPGMLYIKCSGRIFTICASKNEAICCEVQTHFGSSLSASFTEKVLGAISPFVRAKTKRVAAKFRHFGSPSDL